MARRTILCFASYFLPGFKSGGPVRSLSNLCAWLRERYDLRIVTRNHDLGDPAPYPQRQAGQWFEEAGALVWYLDRPTWAPGGIRRVVMDARPDVLYFQSFLDPAITIAPLVLRRLGLLPTRSPVIVAPRGEFAPEALALKRGKKSAYLALARRLHLYEGVTWHATSDVEAGHIRSWAGPEARVAVAPNLPPRDVGPGESRRRPKEAGVVRLVFLSRIAPMKNLDGALQMLGGVKARVELDIFGTQEDPAYWQRCESIIRRLPGNISARYVGVVRPDEVLDTLAAYDALYLPSRGENFGHVILESLLAGCPVLISDRTPWRDLAARRAGFDLPLEQAAAFQRAIEALAAMDQSALAAWTRGAREFGMRYCQDHDVAGPTLNMLDRVLGP